MKSNEELRREWETDGNLGGANAWMDRSVLPERLQEFVEEARYEGFRRVRGGRKKNMTDAQRTKKSRLLARLSQTLEDLYYITIYMNSLGVDPGIGWFRKKDWAKMLNLGHVETLVRASVSIHDKEGIDLLLRILSESLEPNERIQIVREVQ